jgi:hypothetical protein
MFHGAGQQFGKRASVTIAVGTAKGLQILSSISFVDDGRWVASANEHEIQHKATSSTVSVEERVNTLEVRMEIGQVKD